MGKLKAELTAEWWESKKDDSTTGKELSKALSDYEDLAKKIKPASTALLISDGMIAAGQLKGPIDKTRKKSKGLDKTLDALDALDVAAEAAAEEFKQMLDLANSRDNYYRVVEENRNKFRTWADDHKSLATNVDKVFEASKKLQGEPAAEQFFEKIFVPLRKRVQTIHDQIRDALITCELMEKQQEKYEEQDKIAAKTFESFVDQSEKWKTSYEEALVKMNDEVLPKIKYWIPRI